jgi:hypothetical protein
MTESDVIYRTAKLDNSKSMKKYLL